MKSNLLTWTNVDSFELRILLQERFGRPGQYFDRAKNPNRLYLPLADDSCRVILDFKGNEIVSIEPGQAFDANQWAAVADEIDALPTGRPQVGREYSFCGFRVEGSWMGERSGVQILPPHPEAPRAAIEIADHPFILEFPITASTLPEITRHRRIREHRRFTLMLNVVLRGGVRIQNRQRRTLWAGLRGSDDTFTVTWVQETFFAPLGQIVSDSYSPSAAVPIEVIESTTYYADFFGGMDGKPLRVPSDLDDSICKYRALSTANRARFDRAAFWFDMASRQWDSSMSISFASLVSAIESLCERGDIHRVFCSECGRDSQHDSPGATETFRAFIETYAPGVDNKTKNRMYSLRSGILHGNELIQFDEDAAFGWDPPGWNQRELHSELWKLTRTALRNWLDTA